MDGNTEPIIAVIGHPIAGNPAQFALERALESMQLEWRVFSFDVSPDDLATALNGLDVLGVRGVLIDPTLATAAGAWRAEAGDDDRQLVDCLYRSEDESFVKFGAQFAWLQSLINQHAETLKRDIEKTIVIGDEDNNAAWRGIISDATIDKIPRNRDKISDADLVIIQPSEEVADVELEIEDWPPGDDSVLVIDLSDGHPDLSTIQSMGYKVVTAETRRIEMLNACLRHWTSDQAHPDILHDVIEEYLAV